MFERQGCAVSGVAVRRWRAVAAARMRLLVGALLLVTSQSNAQTAVDGVIRGVAVDAAAAAIAGAAVRAEDPSRALVFATSCDVHGGFLFARVPAGTYTVTISAAGFATLSVDRVAVEPGGVAELAIRLKPAGVRTAITVTDEGEEGMATLDQPSGASLSSVVRNSEMEALPLNGRRWQSFALMAPAANAGDQGDGLLSFRGLAVTQNSTTLDGVNDDQSFSSVARGSEALAANETDEESGAESGGARRSAASWRRSGVSYAFSQAAVREFRVNTHNYTALYGHGTGGVIATVSKTGSNELHGTGFYLARTSAWNATNPFSIATRYHDGAVTSEYVKPHDLRQQFGGTLGGAVLRDRLFFFYAYDQQRRGFPAISSPGDPAFYALTPTQRALLANRGVTSPKINAALNYLDSLSGSVDRRDDQTINFVRLDWQLSARHRLTAQYNRTRSSLPAGLRGAPVVDRGIASLGSGYTKLDTVVGRWQWTPSAHLVNEVRIAYSRNFQSEQAQTPLAQEPAIGPGGYAPEIAVGSQNGFTFGTPANVGRRAYPDERRVQLVDTVSWQRGHHLLQAGVDFSAVDDNVAALNNVVGSFHYDSGATGNTPANGRAGGLVDWITDYTFNVNAYPNGGCPSINAPVHLFCFRSFTQSFGEQSVAFSTQEWAGFVQDNWHPRTGLAINTGLRYEYVLLPLPQHPNAAFDAVFRERGATSIFPEDRNNFGPRVSVAWSPFGARQGVVRIGYGIFYGRVSGATIRSALMNTALPSSSTHIRITPSTITACPQLLSQGFGYVCTYVSPPPAAVASTTSASVFSRRFRSPMVQQGSMALERGVGAGFVASATYLVNIDHQLPGSVDINIAPPTGTTTFRLQGGTNTPGVRDGDTFILPTYTSRVSDSYGTVTAVTSNVNASYNALALEMHRRSRGGLELRLAWTWSKAIDSGQTAGAAPRLNGQLDPFTVQYDKGLSRLNYPHKVVVGAVWEPKLRTADQWLRRIANGWTASGLFYETSGSPYSYEIFGGARLSGGRESINGSGGAVYLPTVGRNTLRLPDTVRVDLRLSRVVALGEKVRLRGSVEAFNIANHVNYTGVEQRAFLVGTPTSGVTPLIFQDAATVAAEGLNTRPFGTYAATAADLTRERQLQMGVRIDF